MPNRTGTIIADGVRLRTGPGTDFPILGLVSADTPFTLIEEHETWLHVEIQTDNRNGFVHRDFALLEEEQTPGGFIAPRPEVLDVPLTPDEPITLDTRATHPLKTVARIWNAYGGLLTALADHIGIDPAVAVAVLAVESSGRAFDRNGRLIIRFENHVFWRKWGKDHADPFNTHFRFNPDPGQGWRDHQFRHAPDQPWQTFHGDQDKEWQVFELARQLNDEAAKLSISMGSPQIMGFNYATIGYESVHQMFDAFSRDERAQIVALFDFIKGPGTTSPALLALQRGEFDAFAAIYNGPARAARYGERIQAFVEAFHAIRPA